MEKGRYLEEVPKEEMKSSLIATSTYGNSASKIRQEYNASSKYKRTLSLNDRVEKGKVKRIASLELLRVIVAGSSSQMWKEFQTYHVMLRYSTSLAKYRRIMGALPIIIQEIRKMPTDPAN
ncbi:hypothetical protein HNY73_017278 [Argiope bruennichi]|uniref:Uncharacterized protein n=1 Tax=Argiope bruennichi TaxID=94029 RepID=A0A8T0EMK7_ARGBR|nr:hypothetical protein HNY73_017278 [Argiope bruennichi]